MLAGGCEGAEVLHCSIYSISHRKERVGANSRFTLSKRLDFPGWLDVFEFPLPGRGRNCQLHIRSSSIQVPGEGGE